MSRNPPPQSTGQLVFIVSCDSYGSKDDFFEWRYLETDSDLREELKIYRWKPLFRTDETPPWLVDA